MSTIDTAQTIRDAKATLTVLNKRGWTQGTWCRGHDRGFCLGGAMAYAITREVTNNPSCLTNDEQARFTALAEAMNLPVPTGYFGRPVDYVVRYNDEIAKTAANVKAALSGTITRLTTDS